jgi:hypothetical protein
VNGEEVAVTRITSILFGRQKKERPRNGIEAFKVECCGTTIVWLHGVTFR